MSSKSGKSEAKVSQTSSGSSAISVSSSTSSVATTKVTTSTYENGFQILEDWSMPGFLSLKELNTLLLKYIGQVQDLELNQNSTGTSSSITVNIDRSEITNLKSKYDDQLEEWKKKCAEKDKEIAALKAEITKLKAEIKRLKESNSNKDGIIQERDLTIEGLRAEINKLKANLSMFQNQKEIYELQIKRLQDEIKYLTSELNAITNAFAAEQNRSQDLSAKLDSLEKDLRFKIDVLGSELASERGKTNIDISSLDTRIQTEYADRMKDELKILRKMYEEHMRVSEETLKMTYEKKVSDLEVALDVQMNAVKPTEDITELKIDLEKYRKKIEELGSNNRDLSMQWSKLSVELKERESAFQAKMSAKEIEMDYLVKQNAEYKKMYEEMRSKLIYEASEVKVYNMLITPEADRIKSRYSEQFGNGVMSSSKKSFKFSHSSNGQMGRDSYDEDTSKSIQMSQSVSKTSTAQKVSKETVQTSSSSGGSVAAKKN